MNAKEGPVVRLWIQVKQMFTPARITTPARFSEVREPMRQAGVRRTASAAVLGAAILAVLTMFLGVSVARADGTATFSATETIPVPPASNYAGSGGGDGWGVALSDTQVFNVFHHQSTLTVACHQQSDASACWNPETITDSSGDNFATTAQPGLYLDQNTGHLYVFATRTSDGTGGVVCIDTTQATTNTDPFCGFTALTGAGEAPLGSEYSDSTISAPMIVGHFMYGFNYVSGATAANTENQLLCFDLSTDAACAGQPFSVDIGSGAVSLASWPGTPAAAPIENQLIIPITVGGSDELACFDGAAQAACSGSWPVPISSGYISAFGAPYPLMSSGGTITGLCLPTGADPCYTLTGAAAATPSGMSSVITGGTPWDGQAFVLGPRVYVPMGNAGSGQDEVACYDYSTSAGCQNFPKTFQNLSYLYSVNPDPQRPTCLWVNSDAGADQIQNFDAYTGGACGQGPIRVLASSIVAPGQTCVPATYSSLQVLSPPPGQYSDGSVQFEDPDGNPLPIATEALDATGTASLTGLNLNTALGLPEFLITLNGTQGTPSQVVVKLTWTGTNDPSCVRQGITVTPNTPAAGKPAAGKPTSAVVFVSGLDSTQEFSDPQSFAAGCGATQAAGTWGWSAASVASASALSGRYQVFDAPADNGGKHGPDCAHVQQGVPGAFHLDTHDDSDETTNGSILLGFLGWLHVHYGINDVWLVGHSYGGIWSRSALTQLAAGRSPIAHIDGIITVGTPHTGSFGADLYSDAASDCLDALFSNAARVACAAAVGVREYFGNAINGLTHNALTAWNASQTQQTQWGCVPIATMAGTEFSPPSIGALGPKGYVSPNDVIVGELSADGNGPGSSITRLMNVLETPMTHITVPFTSAPVETHYSVVNQEIETILGNLPKYAAYEAKCPGRVAHIAAVAASAATKHVSYTIQLGGLGGVKTNGHLLTGITAGTTLLAGGGTKVSCGKKVAAEEPLLGLSRYEVIIAPRCGSALKLSLPHRSIGIAAVMRSHASITVTLLGRGKLSVIAHGLGRSANLRVILTRSRRKTLRTLKAVGLNRLRVKAGSYQLQAIARLGHVVLGGSIPLQVA